MAEMITLTDGLHRASDGTHQTLIMVEAMSEYYATDLSDEDRVTLEHYISQLRVIRDGCAKIGTKHVHQLQRKGVAG